MIVFWSKKQGARNVKQIFCRGSMLNGLRFFAGSCAIILLCSCGKDQTAPAADTSTYQTYQHNGFTIRYPSHWTLKFDDAPDFSTDRAVIFEPSELSRVTVSIDQNRKSALDTIANDYANRLGLTDQSSIVDYQRTPIDLDGHKGVKLSWQETEIFKRKVEVIILELINFQPQVFIIFDLDEEDIDKETAFILPVVKSIQLN